jgi:hypothetical protein
MRDQCTVRECQPVDPRHVDAVGCRDAPGRPTANVKRLDVVGVGHEQHAAVRRDRNAVRPEDSAEHSELTQLGRTRRRVEDTPVTIRDVDRAIRTGRHVIEKVPTGARNRQTRSERAGPSVEREQRGWRGVGRRVKPCVARRPEDAARRVDVNSDD